MKYLPRGAEFFAWGFLYLDLLMLVTRSGGAVTDLDVQATYRIVMVALAGLLLVATVARRPSAVPQLIRPPLVFMATFSVVGVASAAYSSAPMYSLFKAAELCAAVLAVAVTLGNQRPQWAVLRLYQLTVLFIAVTAASVVIGMVIDSSAAVVPEKGLIPIRVQGVWPVLNSNSVGFLAAVVALHCLVRCLTPASRSHLMPWMLFSIVFTALLVFSTSRTAMIALVLGVLAFAIASRRRKLTVTMISVGLLFAVLDAAQYFVRQWFEKGQAESTISSLSGRTGAWEAAWEAFLRSPIVGYGFASGGRIDALGGSGASTLHGALFDVLVGVGLIGTVPWLLAIVGTGITLAKAALVNRTRTDTVARAAIWPELAGMYVMLLVRTSTNSSLALHEKESMLFLAVMAVTMVKFTGRSTEGPGLAKDAGVRYPNLLR